MPVQMSFRRSLRNSRRLARLGDGSSMVGRTSPSFASIDKQSHPNHANGGPPAPAPAARNNPGFPDYEDANGDRYPENLNRFKIAVGYRTGNHTGSSVPITAEGAGALLFLGYFDQTDVFFKMARVLSTNTRPLDKALKSKFEGGCDSV